ncbi:MAG TPA: type II toxin-antitoxin system VapC family toxin [Terriglobales bacterium]|jgi:predicted nucleic acid-binding protein
MTVLLDSSALAKLYLDEPEKAAVRDRIARAGAAAVASIAYPETRAALAAAQRQRRIDARQLAQARLALDQDWTIFDEIPVTARLCREAGMLAEVFALRGYDSVQLASYIHLVRDAEADEITLCSFDDELNRAASLWLRRFRRGH